MDQTKKALQKILEKAKSIASYFNPQSNGGNNFWSTPAANSLATAQKLIQQAPKAVSSFPLFNAPQINLPKAAQNVGQALTPIMQKAINYVASQPIINQPVINPPFLKLPFKSPTVGDVAKFGQEAFIQAPAQFGAGLALSARNAVTGENNNSYTPDNPFSKFLLGDKPVKNIQGQGQDISQGLQSIGLPKQYADQAGIPLVLGLGALNFVGLGGAKEKAAQEAISLAKKATTLEEFTKGLNAAKPEIKTYVADILKENKAIKTTEDFYAVVKKSEPLTPLRQSMKTGNYTNVRNIDDRLAQTTGELPTSSIKSTEPLGRTLTAEDIRVMRNENANWLNEPLPWETQQTSRTFVQDLAKNSKPLSQKEKVFEDFIMKEPGTPVAKKIAVWDYFRTPDRVLEKIGLGSEAKLLRTSYEAYQSQLPKDIEIISQWAKKVPANENQALFRYLDGQANIKSLSPGTQKVAGEIKTYLSEWADKLKLPEDKRITSYITHIFPQGAVEKEFPEDIAAIIKDKVAGSTYDPFVTQRLGKLGYKEDTWAALDAYTKRAVRKFNMDPALEKIANASMNLEESQFNFVKNYVDRINMRPTAFDNLLDNTIKQIVGYKFGTRPTTAISQFLRKMVYRGTLGFNVGTALKNLTQGVNTYAKLGEKYTVIGYTKLFTNWKAAVAELERVGVLKDEFIQDRTINATKKFWEKADKYGFYALFNLAEKINRGAAYFGAKAQALKKGMDEVKAIEYAKKIVRDTQFTFGIDTPLALQSDLAKTLLQFQSFNIKQTEFMAEMIKNKQFAQITRYTLASIATALTVGKLIGMNPEDFIPFYGVITGKTKLGQTPITKAAMDIPSMLPGSRDKYGNVLSTQDKLGIVGNDLIPFIPGGTQAKKTIQGIQAYQQGASQTPTGKTRFNVEQNPLNLIKAATLGQYSLPGAQDYFNNLGKSKSQIIYEALNSLGTPEEKTARWDALVQDGTINKGNAADVRQKFIDAKLNLSDSEKDIRSLTVNDGSRAEKIVEELSKLKTPQEKTALWDKYVSAKIITSQVSKQIKALLAQQKK